MTRMYGPRMLGLGLTALAASLMSGLAANVSAFAAIWTGDIYCTYLRRNQTDEHYLLMGRLSAAAAIVISVLASLITFLFSNLMENIQLIFSVFGSPFWAILDVYKRQTGERTFIAAFWSHAAASQLAAVVTGNEPPTTKPK